MNHSFIPLFNIYKTAVIRKKKTAIIKYSQQNLLFVVFMKNNGLIAGFNTQKQCKNKIITLFIKYNYKKQSAIIDYSLASKTTKPSVEKGFKRNKDHVNFIINMKSTQGKYGKLLSRLR